MKKKFRILICPLNWGLGHASRDAYLIRFLLEQGYDVIIGGEGASIEFLKTELPGLKYTDLPSFQIRFSAKYPAWFMITLLLPGFFTWMIRENKLLQQVIRKYEIDLVISDTRYGLWSSLIPSVIITHQISFKLPLLLKPFHYLLYRINRIALNRFSQCWIPDFPGYPNLSGSLTHRYKLPVHTSFIGPLSRFHRLGNEIVPENGFEIAAILSGPEPQRSIFEKMITEHLARTNRRAIIVCGLPGRKISENLSTTILRVSYATGIELLTILKTSKYIICRSGYSTIMDLAALNKTAMLVPTPGQTEQEYIARHMAKQGFFLFTEQKDFNLEIAIGRLEKFTPDMQLGENSYLLEKVIHGLPSLMEKSKFNTSSGK